MCASNLEILAYEASPLGPLCLRRRELLSDPGTVVTEITLNHEFLMSSYNTESERALTKIGINHHPGDELRVLVGGLGLGYTAREALASNRVASVQVIELLPEVISWLDTGLFPTSVELKSDPRLSVIQGDVYKTLDGTPKETWDVILIDVDHSPADRLGTEEQPFYTEDGLQRARKHLKRSGVLGVWSYAEDTPFSHALGRVFEDVKIVPVTVTNDLIDEEQTDWLFFGT